MTSRIDIEQLKKENESLKAELLANKIASDLGNLKVFVEDKVKIQKELELLKLKIESEDDFEIYTGSDEENSRLQLIIQNLENQNKDLSKENNRLTEDKKSYIKERKELYASLDRSKDQVDLLNNENNNLYEQVESHRQSSDENEEALNFFIEKNNQLKQEIDRLKSNDYEKVYKDEIERLKSDIKIANDTIEKKNYMISRNEILIKEIKRKQNNLKTLDQNKSSQPKKIKIDVEKLSKLPALKPLIDLNGFLIAKLEEESRNKLLGYKYNATATSKVTEDIKLSEPLQENETTEPELTSNQNDNSHKSDLNLTSEDAIEPPKMKKEEDQRISTTTELLKDEAPLKVVTSDLNPEAISNPEIDLGVSDDLFGEFFAPLEDESSKEADPTQENNNNNNINSGDLDKSRKVDAVTNTEEIPSFEVIDDEDELVDSFFKNLNTKKIDVSKERIIQSTDESEGDEKSKSTFRGDLLLPSSEILSEEELERYAKKLSNYIEFGNYGKIDEKELFIFLVSFAFYHYEDAHFWDPLFEYLNIDSNLRIQMLFTNKVKAASDIYGYLLYNANKKNMYVESIKMHTMLPLNYVDSVLPTLYRVLYRDFKGHKDRGVFNTLISDMITNGEVYTIKTIFNLWESGAENVVLDYLFELMLAIEAFDSHKYPDNLSLRDDIQDEVKKWVDYSSKYEVHDGGVLDNFFNKTGLKDPSFTLKYKDNQLKINSFTLPDTILHVRVNITNLNGDRETRKISYSKVKSDNIDGFIFKTDDLLLTIDDEKIFAEYEIEIDTDDAKKQVIYRYNREFILLDDNDREIKSLESYEKDNFHIQYRSDIYEVITSDVLSTGRISNKIEWTLLDKNKINYLRNRITGKKVKKDLTIHKGKDTQFIIKKVEGLYRNNYPVFSSHPEIYGYDESSHTIFINGKKARHIIKESDIKEYKIDIYSKSKKKVINSIKYFYIPNLSAEFIASYKNSKGEKYKKSYIFNTPEYSTLTIDCNNITEISSPELDEGSIVKESYGIEIEISTNDLIKLEDELSLNTLYEDTLIPLKYKIPRLSWEINGVRHTDNKQQIYEKAIIGSQLKVYKGNYSPIEVIDIEKDHIDYIKKYKKNKVDTRRTPEALFKITDTPLVITDEKLIFWPVSSDNILNIKCNEISSEKAFKDDKTPLTFDKEPFHGMLEYSILKKGLFSEERLKEDIVPVNYYLEPGDILTISNLEIYNKATKEDIPLGGIPFEYLGASENGFYKGKITKFTPSKKDPRLKDDTLYFKIDFKNLIIKNPSMMLKSGDYVFINYKLNSDSTLKNIFPNFNRDKINFRGKKIIQQDFGFKLRRVE